MSSDALNERGRALEEAFFAQKNQELLKAFHEKLEADERRAEIAAVTGVSDDETLDKLVEIGVDAQSIAAVALIPLIRVAWADRNVESKERDAIMAAAKESGISSGDAAFDLLRNWLDDQPGDGLYAAWADYVAVLKETLDTATFAKLGEQVVARANAVASAAGGILGFGKISDVEQNVLNDVKQAFA